MNLLLAGLFIIVFDCKVEIHSFTKETIEYCEREYEEDCSGDTIHDYQSEGHIVDSCFEASEDELPKRGKDGWCSCTTDAECAYRCGGNGNPDPYALDANRDPETGEELD